MYQLTEEQFKALTAAYFDVVSLQSTLTGVVNQTIEDKIANAISQLNLGLAEIRAADEEREEQLANIAAQVQEQEELSSYWSADDVEDFDAECPYSGFLSLEYSQHWGGKVISIELPKRFTWRELWRIANDAILQSGDLHHVYIESFENTDPERRRLVLSTGS